MISPEAVAVCCMSGGYKNAFTQGVLQALEQGGFRADAYAACSSSALIAAFAAFGQVSTLDLSLWEQGYAISREDGGDQSRAMLESIRRLSPAIRENLWQASASRLMLAASFVKTGEAASIVSSDGARRLGQMLLIQALRHKSDWREQHLEAHTFDTRPTPLTRPLTPENFDQAAYATTRMLHLWSIPATIDGLPYLDGSYTALCPVTALAEAGYRNIVCICTEHERITFDLFSEREIPERIDGARITFLKPDCNLKELGTDYYSTDGDGLTRGFEHGIQKGREYLQNRTSEKIG